MTKPITDTGYLKSLTELLPDKTELFVGITFVLEGGQFKQKKMFGQIRGIPSVDKSSKKRPIVKEKDNQEDQKLLNALNNASIEEAEF